MRDCFIRKQALQLDKSVCKIFSRNNRFQQSNPYFAFINCHDYSRGSWEREHLQMFSLPTLMAIPQCTGTTST